MIKDAADKNVSDAEFEDRLKVTASDKSDAKNEADTNVQNAKDTA